MPQIRGARVGPYEIVEPLGTGGVGEVYRAWDPKLGRQVAINVLNLDATANAAAVRRFEQEARVMEIVGGRRCVICCSADARHGDSDRRHRWES